ncbi:LacI family DNA-binding transcriptional regulator [Devosia sp. RR2S18]|uniref:LacI family DNA-binding transcriptional regulator n=1 Tax=Devosia rhizosphaerae TaxID=3049774 RepID=UPI00253F7B1F|nr:LacI family DNA-binding transcriptional regulator [Devosia sp. RR2S18]WIJ26442.1 LacI family DNA-binding transcriptional regulator [Devosia sp. RR2S18]
MTSSASDRLPSADRQASGSGRVTMADIGRLAGVSQVTVSRALSDPSKVSAETLQRIKEAIRLTGFVPNALAGALASSKSNLIAALVPSITNVVYSSTLHAFSEIMRGHGYQIMLSETGHSQEREEEVVAALLSRRPDGMLLTGVHHSPSVRRMLMGAGIPVVEVWDVTETPIDVCIGFSHAAAGAAAADFAFESGYRRAATITAADQRAERRRDAFISRFNQRGGESVVKVDVAGSATLKTGREAALQLIERGDSRGSVVFCSSDQFAQGILVEAKARGVGVPSELAVIGFGDQEFAAYTEPALTSVRVDRDLLGSAAADALINRFKPSGQATAPVHDIGFEIVKRGSA